MAKKSVSLSSLLVIVSLALAIGACGGSPTAPSGGFDPSKPVDENNRPPGPGEGVRASVQSWGVYEGDCPALAVECGKELVPTSDPALQVPGVEKTYILVNHRQVYTLRMCVIHPGVPGRRVLMYLRAVMNNTSTQGLGMFDEADSSKTSPVCAGVSFNMVIPGGGGVTNTATGEAKFEEGSQDLFTATEWKVTLGFRVQP